MAPHKPITFLPLGALIKEFHVNGKNIVQGFSTVEQYKSLNEPYFGVTIGRIANRVAHGKINKLNGRGYELPINNGPNSLHGGIRGFGKRDFEGPSTVTRDGKEATFFKYVSRDGEEGYPGTVEVRVWYVQTQEQMNGVRHEVLDIEYEVELVGDEVEETAVSLTNHSYFNLSNRLTIAGTQATLATNRYQVIDDNFLPTGTIKPYDKTQPGQMFILGEEEPAIDNCFVINDDPSSVPIDTRSEPYRKAALFYHPDSKIHLEIQTTEPCFQFYTGEHIDVPATNSLPARGARAGFCIEPSRYLNAVNVPEQKATVVLKKGERYGSRIEYRAWHGSS